ncbi:hypothetical protein DQE80_15430, partial [Enterococcus sp. HPCN18]
MKFVDAVEDSFHQRQVALLPVVGRQDRSVKAGCKLVTEHDNGVNSRITLQFAKRVRWRCRVSGICANYLGDQSPSAEFDS